MKVVKYILDSRPTLNKFKKQKNIILTENLIKQGVPNLPINRLFKMRINVNVRHNDYASPGKIMVSIYECMELAGIVRKHQNRTSRRSEIIVEKGDGELKTEITLWIDENDERNEGIAFGLLPILEEFSSDSFHPDPICFK